MLQRVMTAFLSRMQECILVTIKCYIQTIMTEINSHGHDMHPIVSIEFLHFALKIISFKTPSGVSEASCTQTVMKGAHYSC